MWCTRCHADVAGELAENGQALNCASCGHEIQKIYTPSLHPEIRSARELLERWSREERISPPPPPEPATTAAETTPSVSLAAAAAGEKESAPRNFSAEFQKHLQDSSADSPRSHGDLISTNLKPPGDAAAAADASSPSAPLKASAKDSPAANTPATASAETAEQKTRKLLDRPAISRTARPKTIWRADTSHAAGGHDAAEEVPKTVAPLQSIDTLTPPPLPARPPRALQPSPALTSPDASTSALSAKPSPARPSDASSSARQSSAEDESASGTRDPGPPAFASAPRRSGAPRRRRFDAAEAVIASPHFDLQTYLDQHPQKAGRSETLWGQLVAYAGVAVLTVGTTMVLWGYFGGLGKYTSTGFLISTAGQMLLFLGVVTLVSGGMQQTSQDVSTRVEYLGDRMIRMEQATQQVLRSPHFARRRSRRSSSRAGAPPRPAQEGGASDAA